MGIKQFIADKLGLFTGEELIINFILQEEVENKNKTIARLNARIHKTKEFVKENIIYTPLQDGIMYRLEGRDTRTGKKRKKYKNEKN